MTNTHSCQKGTIKNNLHKLYVGWALFDAVFPLAIMAMAQLQPYGQPGSGPWGSGIPGWLIKSCCQGHGRLVSDLPCPLHQLHHHSLLTLSLPPQAGPLLWPSVVSAHTKAAATGDRERPPVIIWDNIPLSWGWICERRKTVYCAVCLFLFIFSAWMCSWIKTTDFRSTFPPSLFLFLWRFFGMEESVTTF